MAVANVQRSDHAASSAGWDGRPLLLVLRALGLGDLLAAVPALVALRDAFPDHRRVLAAPAALAPVAAWSSAIEELVDTEPLADLAARLHGADVAVNLHGHGPRSTQTLLAAHPRRLLAFAHADVPELADGPAWDEAEHERERWCRLLRAGGIPADPARVGITVPEGPVPADPAGAVLVHPGAARPAVRWPARHFAAVAAALHDQGCRVLVTGGPDEAALATAVAAAAGLPDGAVLAGRSDLDGLARLVAGAAAVVSSDTGIAHLAFALGTSSVTIYGPVSPVRWGPPHHPRHRVLWTGHEGDPHAPAPASDLATITPAAVLSELATALAHPTSSSSAKSRR